jgi:hypothetical protein
MAVFRWSKPSLVALPSAILHQKDRDASESVFHVSRGLEPFLSQVRNMRHRHDHVTRSDINESCKRFKKLTTVMYT